ncbi:hypothetical protein LTR66_005696 [Elasticomyces elasticus]|nr:hypothetical protein LTR66_005696 [Elasticomyces elasticus]
MIILLTVQLAISLALALASSSDQCSCGFYDASSQQLYAESIIVYFNETSSLPSDVLAVQDFTHRSEKGWTSLFRHGARPFNARIGNFSTASWPESVNKPSLELFVDAPTPDHLVYGAAAQSVRQDIQYGTFRASMRSAHPRAGGSALSMMLYFNESNSISIDMMNMNTPEKARMTTLINGEYPSQSVSTNYSTIATGSTILPPVSPWDFLDVRFDWTKEAVNFTLASNLTRSVSTVGHNLPTLPSHMLLKHWSTGDVSFMQGPPVKQSVANVAWIRWFFNSSLTTADARRAFDDRCNPSSACSVDDLSLRGSTIYHPTALLPWHKSASVGFFRLSSALVAAAAGFFGVIALTNVLVRRIAWHKLFRVRKSAASTVPPVLNHDQRLELAVDASTEPTLDMMAIYDALQKLHDAKQGKEQTDTSDELTISAAETPYDARSIIATSPPSKIALTSGGIDMVAVNERTPNSMYKLSVRSGPNNQHSPPFSSGIWSSAADTLVSATPVRSGRQTPKNGTEQAKSSSSYDLSRLVSGRTDDTYASQSRSANQSGTAEKVEDIIVPERGVHPDILLVSLPTQQIATKSQRIDYLAGLVALSCIAVTFVHFSLTFLPYTIGITDYAHSKSEYGARWSVGPYILTPIWIGPFFTTSCRFLVTRFLQDGNLANVANKMLLRAPRMLVPVAILAMLEYFFIEQGFTSKLKWLPSITWSSWPYVTNYPNFGYFINEVLELGFLIPNAAPQIVSHYCVGVLWTIPVQLQFSYATLLYVVMIREIKTNWKRFTFYAFCITLHWYALSWGSCFWIGLMLADLEITFNYTKRIQAKPLIHYPLLTVLCILTVFAPTWFLLEDRLHVNVMSLERGIHPDASTGLPIGKTPRAGYPLYFEPRLNTLIFATSLQMIVELSTWTQKVLSLRIFIWIFPHIMTVYLIHGFVFWSLGAWLCVSLSVAGLPYWANMLIVWVCCYATIGLASVLLTPLTEKTAMALSRNLWRWASQEPVPQRPTLAPFPKGLFIDKATDRVGVVRDEEAQTRSLDSTLCSRSDEGGEKSVADAHSQK